MNPRERYSQLLQQRREEIEERESRHRMLGYVRLAVVAAALAIVWAALATERLSVVWVVAPIAVFAILIVAGDRLLSELARRRRAADYFERGLARLDGKWAGTGEAGDSYASASHPYAQDLDLFGRGSLFELLCTARTHAGSDTLARWMLAPAEPEVVRSRQEAVAELRPRLDLREDLAVVAEEARTGVDPDSLAAWGEAPPLLESRGLRMLLRILTLLGCCGFAALWVWLGYMAGLLNLTEGQATLARDLFLFAVVVNSLFLYLQRAPIAFVAGAVEAAAQELGLMSEVLVRLEREQFRSPLLARLRASLDVEGDPPSLRLRRLRRIVEGIDSRDNIFVRLLEPFILWTPHQAVRAEDWRRHSGRAVRRWLTAMGEIEALCSLSSHAYEHPADPFPEFAESGPLLEARQIGHPLIPEGRVVRNDVRIGGELRVLVVSGSNMSGKSTLLRTLGVNAVLAQAGAPVRAEALRISPLAVGASIRVTDSLQGGVSRFYAEILRLRQILDQTGGPLPVLFLVDEFLHGTNSHDRRIGAQALVHGLVERGAAGLITTHDLALAEIAESLDGQAANVHFEDQIEDGKIRFDYRMRPGVVRKSNAIELMRSVGLEI
jgi:MutS domain V